MFDAAGQDFLAWWDTVEQDPQEAIKQLNAYRFVGAEFVSAVTPALAAVYEFGWEDGATTLRELYNSRGEVELEFSSVKAHRWAKKYSADLVVQIDDATRNMVKRAVENSVNREQHWSELKQTLLADNHGFSESRCETIARTESGRAYNVGAVECWRESQLVDSVRVVDGDYDAACIMANGQTWTFERAFNHPLEHPRCVREFFPVLSERASIRGSE